MTDLARAAGRWAAVPLGAIARARHGRPMHPRGAVFDAVLHRVGSTPPTGIAWLDEQARDDVVVRLSRGAGLPAALPDVLGLAIRIPGDRAPVDLLLSSTGRGPIGRLLPVPRWDAATSYFSIMGYRTAAGTVRLAAFPDDDEPEPAPSEPVPLAAAVRRDGFRFTLHAALGAGAWQSFARLTLGAPREPLDSDLRFDAVLNPPPGLAPDGPLARIRQPAYARARAEGRR